MRDRAPEPGCRALRSHIEHHLDLLMEDLKRTALIVVAGLACYLPARSAVRVDQVVALRGE